MSHPVSRGAHPTLRMEAFALVNRKNHDKNQRLICGGEKPSGAGLGPSWRPSGNSTAFIWAVWNGVPPASQSQLVSQACQKILATRDGRQLSNRITETLSDL